MPHLEHIIDSHLSHARNIGTPLVGENLRRVGDLGYGDSGPLSQVLLCPLAFAYPLSLLVCATTGTHVERGATKANPQPKKNYICVCL